MDMLYQMVQKTLKLSTRTRVIARGSVELLRKFKPDLIKLLSIVVKIFLALQSESNRNVPFRISEKIFQGLIIFLFFTFMNLLI